MKYHILFYVFVILLMIAEFSDSAFTSRRDPAPTGDAGIVALQAAQGDAAVPLRRDSLLTIKN